MTILTLPSSPGIRASRWGLRGNTAAFISPFNGFSMTVEQIGAMWHAQYTLPPMSRSQAAAWLAFLVNLNGRGGRFYGYDPDCRTPRGTWAGSPVVNGSNQGGASLILDGFTAGATVRAGDYFQVGTELKMVTADGTADGSGNLTVSFKPVLRGPPADDAAIVSTNPVCIMMLADDEQAAWDADMVSLFGVSFSAVEAIHEGFATSTTLAGGGGPL
ncbi:MAG: hypothetical protein AB7E70_20930 [Hyphomicrobiaceae bacterium]